MIVSASPKGKEKKLVVKRFMKQALCNDVTNSAPSLYEQQLVKQNKNIEAGELLKMMLLVLKKMLCALYFRELHKHLSS